MNRPLLRSSVAAAILAAIATGPATAQETEDVTLMLDWTPGGIASAWYYGIEQGCFTDQGINLTVERGYGGADTVTKIAAGVAKFGTADLSSIMLGRISADATVKALMPIYSASPLTVAVLESSGIDKIADLEGKTVAASPGDSGIKLLPIAFDEAGADFDAVNVETVEGGTLTGLLIQGKVDAITTYVTTAMIINSAAQNAGKSVKTLNFGADLGVYSNSLFASDETIESDPDLVSRFVKASQCAFEATRENVPAAVAAMNAELGGMDEKLHAGIAETSLSLIFDNPKFEANGWEWDPEAVGLTLSVAVRAQGAKSDADPMSFIVIE